MQVVYKVSINTVKYLEKVLSVGIGISGFYTLSLLSFFTTPHIIPNMSGIGKALNHTVIRKSYGPVTPFESTLNDILGLGYSVHVTHLGVAAELYSLFG